MARTGRPSKKINKENFEGLCRLQCTEREICDFFGCCEDTLNAWCKRTYKDENGEGMTFSDIFKQKRSNGLISLRRSQLRLAEKNASMAIWLGKQYLHQTDAGIIETDDAEQDDGYIEAMKEGAEKAWGAE